MKVNQCPPNSKEWKEFVIKTGSEDRAYQIWMGNIKNMDENGEIPIPNDKQLEELGIIKQHVPKARMLISLLNQQLSDLYGKLGKAKSDQEKVSIKLKIEDKKKEIESLSEKADKHGNRKIVALEEIAKYAEEQLAKVSDMLANQDKVTFADLNESRRVLAMWEKAGDFGEIDHLFFEADEMEQAKLGENLPKEEQPLATQIMKQFQSYSNRAKTLKGDWTRNTISLMEQAGKNESGNLNFEIKTIMKDMGWSEAMLIGASESDSDFFQYLYVLTKKANHNAYLESVEIHKEIDGLLEKISKKRKLSDVFELFKQTFSNDDLRQTGNITFRYSQAYFLFLDSLKQDRENLLRAAENETNDNKRDQLIKNANQRYFEALRNNSISFDMRLLLPNNTLDPDKHTQEKIDAHKAELIATMGQKGYELYLQRAKDKLERYKEERIAYENELKLRNEGDDKAFQIEFGLWDEAHNPYKVAKHNEEGGATKIGNSYVAYSTEYIETVPRRFDKNKKDTGYYDKKFEQIEADEDVLVFYEYFIQTMKTLNEYLPKDKTNFMQLNTLVTVKRGFFESAIEGGIKGFGTELLDHLIKSTRTDDLATQISPESRDITGIAEKELQVQFLEDVRARTNEHIKLESILYKQRTGENPTKIMQEEWRKDFMDSLAKEKSFDLGKVLKAYSAMVMGYKNKALVEDVMRLSEQIVQDSLEQQVNNANDSLTYKDTQRPVTQKGLANTKAMFDDMMNYFWGYSTNKVELKSKTRKYTKLERQEKRRIDEGLTKAKQDLEEKKITLSEYLQLEEQLNIALDKLGGNLTGSKVIDQLLQWIQIKGMGWNFLAAFANMGFGKAANLTEASANERFNMPEYLKAERYVLHSMGKFWSGGAVDTKMAQKIFNLSQKYDMLKQSRHELVKRSEGLETFGKFSKGFKYIMPYTAQASSEYMNQAPVMIAMMLHTKIKLDDGREVALFDMYDENANLKPEYTLPENFEFQFKIKMDEAIMYLHGNYDPDARIGVKQYVLGRMALQFRTWAIMGFYSRFGKEKTSKFTGLTKKGRYRSYAAIYKELGAIKATFEITKQLLRKLAFQSTTFGNLVEEEGYFTEVDAANLRRNLTEIVIFLSLQAMGLLLKAGLDDEEDKTSNRAAVLFSMINQMNRVETDLLFYTNPMEFERLQRNALPIFGLVTDAYDLVDKSINLMAGGEDIYQSGPHKGESKAAVAFMKNIPLANQYNRLASYSSRVFKND